MITTGDKFRTWRLHCGLTQREAAIALGYSEAAVQAVEQDRLPLDRKMARCATAISGVDFFSLMDVSNDNLTILGHDSLSREPFTYETYRAWPKSRFAIFK